MTEKAIATRMEPQPPAPVSETAAILQMIERAAMNQNVDIDKMERLLEMQERIITRSARADYAAALAAMQTELPVIRERGRNTNTGSTYALWEDVNEQIRPILGKYGFSLTFRAKTEGNFVAVTGVLTHSGGHFEETTFTLPVDAGPGRNLVQAHGSSIAYGKRYTAAALLNLTSRGEDDDGRAGGGSAPISAEERQALQDKIDRYGANIETFCKVQKIAALADLPAARLHAAHKDLDAWFKRKRQAAHETRGNG